MSVYDELYSLTRALSNSKEFSDYKRTAERVDSDEMHSRMLKDFITAQMQISSAKMLGTDPTDEMINHFNMLYSAISGIGSINEFLMAQAAFMTILDDVTREIAKAVDVDVNFLKILPDFN